MKLKLEFTNPLVVLSAAPEKSYRAIFTVVYNDVRFKGENMASEMKSGTYATVSVTWTDKGGNPVAVDGSTQWSVTDSTILEIAPSTGNPLIANIHSLGPVGPCQVQASADGDMGPNIRTVSATYDVTVIQGDAVAGSITFVQSPGQGATPGKAKK